MAKKNKNIVELQDEAAADMIPMPVNVPDPKNPDDYLAQMKNAARWIKERQEAQQQARDKLARMDEEIATLKEKGEYAKLKKYVKKIENDIRQVRADGLKRAEQLTLFANAG